MALAITTQPQSQAVNIGDDVDFNVVAESVKWLDPINNSPYGSGYGTITNHTQTSITITGLGAGGYGVTYNGYNIVPSDFYFKATLSKDSVAENPLCIMLINTPSNGSEGFRYSLRSDESNPNVCVRGTYYHATLLNNSDDTTFETIGDCSSNEWYVDVTQGGQTQRLTISNKPLLSEVGELSVVTASISTVSIYGVEFKGVGTAISYQWKKDTVNIPTETSDTLSLTNISNADFANYTVDVGDGTSTVLSDIATLSEAALVGSSIAFRSSAGVGTA